MTTLAVMTLVVLVAGVAPLPQRPGSVGRTCPESCSDGFRQVCGTDGKTYGNSCKLLQVTCRNPSITKQNDGPCVSITRACRTNCPDNYIPICATNGQTFKNQCAMDAATCRDANIKKRYEGECPVPHNAQSSSSSSGSSGSRSPAPPAVGQSVLSLISSSQGNRPAQTPRPTTAVQPARPIAPARPAVQPVAPAPSRPIVRPSTSLTTGGSSNCPETCSDRTRAVCGTDGRTYPNECKLRVAACLNPGLEKRNDGACKKDCNRVCPEVLEPVCGNDGTTYPNSCYLAIANCRDSSVQAARNGPCQPPVNPDCNFQCDDTVSPVCGSDGITYRNLCFLRRAACTKSSLLRLFNGVCEEQRGSRCDAVCPTVVEPVCGDDGVTYVNECQLLVAACRANKKVNVFANGQCRRRNQ